jgi:hypothetical protein
MGRHISATDLSSDGVALCSQNTNVRLFCK